LGCRLKRGKSVDGRNNDQALPAEQKALMAFEAKIRPIAKPSPMRLGADLSKH
jgi:hypothetical protein